MTLKYKFELIIQGSNGMVMNHWIDTDANLLELYKNSLVLGSGIIAWEKGAVDSRKLVAMFDRTPIPPLPSLTIQEPIAKEKRY